MAEISLLTMTETATAASDIPKNQSSKKSCNILFEQCFVCGILLKMPIEFLVKSIIDFIVVCFWTK